MNNYRISTILLALALLGFGTAGAQQAATKAKTSPDWKNGRGEAVKLATAIHDALAETKNAASQSAVRAARRTGD